MRKLIVLVSFAVSLTVLLSADQTQLQNADVSGALVQQAGSPLRPTCLILDMSGKGLLLSSSSDGVRFDVDADGQLELVAWPSVGSEAAFLALDSNGNGRIDNGSELLGTRFSNPLVPAGVSGIDALVYLQRPTIRPDGSRYIAGFPSVERTDEVFSKLRAWVDVNRNGLSEASELKSLPAAGVHSISAGAQRIRGLIQNGNALLFEGLFCLEGDPEQRPSRALFEVRLAVSGQRPRSR